MGYAGSAMGFYGVAWDGERVKVEPLARGLDLTTHWKEVDTRRAIASCFDALVDAIANIQGSDSKRITSPSTPRPGRPNPVRSMNSMFTTLAGTRS